MPVCPSPHTEPNPSSSTDDGSTTTSKDSCCRFTLQHLHGRIWKGKGSHVPAMALPAQLWVSRHDLLPPSKLWKARGQGQAQQLRQRRFIGGTASRQVKRRRSPQPLRRWEYACTIRPLQKVYTWGVRMTVLSCDGIQSRPWAAEPSVVDSCCLDLALRRCYA